MDGWYKSGQELLQEMRKTHLPEGMLAIWYLGQAGLAVKSGELLIGIDLYLGSSENRILPQPFAPEDAGELFDYLLCTHDHEDHLDPCTLRGIAEAGTKTVFVVPAPCTGKLESMGIGRERILPAAAWAPQRLSGGAELLPTPAAHEEFAFDSAGNYLCLGYILKLRGATLYHSGDTVEWESMTEELAPQKPDIMCLPINGSDWKRKRQNIIGNLNSREAADVAEACGAELVIPLHFDMMAGNGENPAHFADYMFSEHKGRRYHIFAPGERYLYMR